MASFLFDFLKQILESFLQCKDTSREKKILTNNWQDALPSLTADTWMLQALRLVNLMCLIILTVELLLRNAATLYEVPADHSYPPHHHPVTADFLV